MLDRAVLSVFGELVQPLLSSVVRAELGETLLGADCLHFVVDCDGCGVSLAQATAETECIRLETWTNFNHVKVSNGMGVLQGPEAFRVYYTAMETAAGEVARRIIRAHRAWAASERQRQLLKRLRG